MVPAACGTARAAFLPRAGRQCGGDGRRWGPGARRCQRESQRWSRGVSARMATNKFSERDGGTACARFMHAHASAQRTHLKPRQAWAKAGSASNITLDMNLRPTKNLIIKFDNQI